MSVPAWLGLGSNVGDALANLRQAATAIGELATTRIVARSSLYRTSPWGDTDQPDFLNAVIEVRTGLKPQDLLTELLGIEKAMGRRRDGRRWGPRVIDLDLLLYDQLEMHVRGLTLPHPRLAERAFVVLPLMEIAPELDIPGRGPVKRCLEALEGQGLERLQVGW